MTVKPRALKPMTRYAAGAVVVALLAGGGLWLAGGYYGFWQDCENNPDAGCLLDEAEAAMAAADTSLESSRILAAIAAARARRGDTGRADALYRQAEAAAAGSAPLDRVSVAMVGAVAVQNGDLDSGRAIFRRVYADLWDIDIPTDMEKSQSMMILSMQAGAGDPAGTLETIAALRLKLWRAEALLTIAEMLARDGKSEALGMVLPDTMRAVQAIPGESTRRKLTARMPVLVAASGDIETARVMADGIADPGKRAMAWRGIAELQAQAGDLAGALESFAKIERPRTREWTLWPIAVAQAKAGDFAAADASIGRIGDALAREQALGDIAAIHAGAGRLDKAMEIAAALEAGFVSTRAWRQIAEARAAAGDIAAAVEIAGKAGDSRDPLLASIGQTRAEAGHIDDARQILAAIGDAGHRDSLSRDIATAQAKAGMMPQAVATARAIPTPQLRAGALAGVAAAMIGG